MRNLYKIKSVGSKGKGVFAIREIKKDKLIMTRDYSRLKRYKAGDKRLGKSNHVDYIGKGEYVIDNSPSSYINHSCNPNTKIVIVSKNKAKIYAIKNIKKGKELTYNYSKSKKELAKAKKEGIYVWKMKCKCGSNKCEKIIRGF